MIKNKMKKVLLTALVISSPMLASSTSMYPAQSLVGIEGGYNSLDYDYGVGAAVTSQNTQSGHLGLKLGAETEDFRVFMSARLMMGNESSYEYMSTAGLELQYKFNAAEFLNFFVGVNAGYAFIEFTPNDGLGYRTINDPYFGGDIGTNIHLSKKVDFEIGAKLMSVQAENIKYNAAGDAVIYRAGNIVNTYVSLIFKWQTD